MNDALIRPRHTLTSELLHLIEDVNQAGRPIKVVTLVGLMEKSETTVRKAVNQLIADGFVRKDESLGLVAVRKNEDDEPEEVNNMADTKTKTSSGRGRPNDPAVQERDGKVLAFIAKTKEGATVEEIAAELKIERNAAYLSVWRLRVAGTIVKTPSGSRAPRWAKAA